MKKRFDYKHIDPLSALQKLPDCGITDRRNRIDFHYSVF